MPKSRDVRSSGVIDADVAEHLAVEMVVHRVAVAPRGNASERIPQVLKVTDLDWIITEHHEPVGHYVTLAASGTRCRGRFRSSPLGRPTSCATT